MLLIIRAHGALDCYPGAEALLSAFIILLNRSSIFTGSSGNSRVFGLAHPRGL
jgi:hypothetical protein